MKKEYGINNKPNLNLARKRLGKETKVIDFEIAQKYQNIGIGKTYMVDEALLALEGIVGDIIAG